MMEIPLDFIANLPTRLPFGPQHVLSGFGLIGLTMLAHVTPHSPGWIMFRRGVALPFIACGWAYLYWVPILPAGEDQWGNAIGCVSVIVRLLEWTFFTAETHCFRVKPKDRAPSTSSQLEEKLLPNQSASGLVTKPYMIRKVVTTLAAPSVLIPEPVPEGFTKANVGWAFSLYGSNRGIGWNYWAPLPQSSMVDPYIRTSKRRPFLLAQLRILITTLLVHDTTRYYITYVAQDFFTGKVPYDDLSLKQKAIFSIVTAARPWYTAQQLAPMFALLLVGLGGILGWEGEMWSPWGYPPFFGGLTELWKRPGLSTMWSKTWHSFWRRFLHVIGWIGIGEKVLRLPPTGLSSHSHARLIDPVPAKASKQPEPAKASESMLQRPSTLPRTPSGYDTPSHPLKTTPSRQLTTKIALTNFAKSVIVFTLTGVLHDAPFLLTHLNKTHPVLPKSILLSDWLVVTPFFVAQPFAIVVEAAIKRVYRRMKAARGISLGSEPDWLVTMERAIGFLAVWVWLGWSARAYVSGMARLNVANWVGVKSFSLTSGVLKGRWIDDFTGK